MGSGAEISGRWGALEVPKAKGHSHAALQAAIQLFTHAMFTPTTQSKKNRNLPVSFITQNLFHIQKQV